MNHKMINNHLNPYNSIALKYTDLPAQFWLKKLPIPENVMAQKYSQVTAGLKSHKNLRSGEL
jgi:hypothetical protein